MRRRVIAIGFEFGMAVAGGQPPTWVLQDMCLPIGRDGGNDRSQFPGYCYSGRRDVAPDFGSLQCLLVNRIVLL